MATNDFQKWLIKQGYYRQNGDGAWMRAGVIVSGKELNDKMNEWIPSKTSPWISVNDDLPEPNIEVYVLYSPRNPIMEGTTHGIMRRITHKTAIPTKLDPNGFAAMGGIVHYWMYPPLKPSPFIPAKEE